jgi:voltage-gated potassium channel
MRVLDRILQSYLAEPLSVRRAMRVISAAVVVSVLVGGVLMRLAEARTFPNIWIGMWWALQTATTVGYGDVVPRTSAGRLIGSLIMLESIAFIAIVTALVTSSFVRRASGSPRVRGPAGPLRASAEGSVRSAAPDDSSGPATEALLRTIDARLRRIERALDQGVNRRPPAP